MKYRLFDVDITSTVSFCFQHETRGSGSGSNEYDLAAVVVHHGSGYVFLYILKNVLIKYFIDSVINFLSTMVLLTFPFHKHFFFIVKKFKTFIFYTFRKHFSLFWKVLIFYFFTLSGRDLVTTHHTLDMKVGIQEVVSHKPYISIKWPIYV